MPKLRDPDEEKAESVFRWRFKALRKAGYSLGAAMRIAETEGVDLHRAVEMLRAGCPEETALRILL